MNHELDMETILRELYLVSGCRVSVHDPESTEIAAYPRELSPFCRLVQTNPQAHLSCLGGDAAALAEVRRSGKPYIYRCHMGLYEAVAPLYSAGVFSGYLMIGQIADSAQNQKDEVFKKATGVLGADTPDIQSLRAAIEALAAMDEARFSSFVSIMQICAAYLTLTDRMHPAQPDLAHQIRQYITVHYAEKVSLDMLCKHFGCSKSTLMNTFRAAYDMTIVAYLTEVRVSHARRMLAESERSIHDISVLCGFAEQGYLTRVFTEATGVSPSAFRRHMKKRLKDAAK